MDIKEEKSVNTEHKMDLDSMLVNELGQFGKYQIIFVPIMCLAMFCGAVFNEYIFSVAKLPHRCMIEECGETSSNTAFTPDWIVNAVPWSDGSPAGCKRYEPIGNGSLDYCPAELFDNRTVIGCDKHVYQTTNSMVYDFNLGCHEWLRSLAGSMSSIGALLCMPISGYVSDKYGRRIVLVASIVFMGAVGVSKAFSLNYPMYMVLSVLQTTLGFGYAGASHIFISEAVGPKYRILANSYCSVFSAIGLIWLGFLAWIFQTSWRHFLLALNAPMLAYGLFYFVLPESLRWLLANERYNDLKSELERIARINGRTLNDKVLENFFRDNEMDEVKKVASRPNVFKYVIKSKILLPRVAIVSFFWISTTFIYYGLSINSTSLSDSTYVNYILTAVVQIPGYLLPAAFPNYGRRTKITFSYFLAGVCNVAFLFIPSAMFELRMTFYLLGMTSIAAVFTTLYAYTSELYPTECRHTLFGISSMIGRTGSILAPLTPALGSYWSGIPSTMFATFGFLACFLGIFVPETLGRKLPETLEDAEDLDRI